MTAFTGKLELFEKPDDPQTSKRGKSLVVFVDDSDIAAPLQGPSFAVLSDYRHTPATMTPAAVGFGDAWTVTIDAGAVAREWRTNLNYPKNTPAILTLNGQSYELVIRSLEETLRGFTINLHSVFDERLDSDTKLESGFRLSAGVDATVTSLVFRQPLTYPGQTRPIAPPFMPTLGQSATTPVYIRLGNEIMEVKSMTASGDMLTLGVTRGSLGTEAEAHAENVYGTEVRYFHGTVPQAVVWSLQIAGVPPIYYDLSQFQRAYAISAPVGRILAEPEAVREGLNRLMELAGTSLVWDYTDSKIKLLPPPAYNTPSPVGDEVIADTSDLTFKEQPRSQATRIDVIGARANPTRPNSETVRSVAVNADAEDSSQYGGSLTRTFRTPWLQTLSQTDAAARGDGMALRLLGERTFPWRVLSFQVERGSVSLGQVVEVTTERRANPVRGVVTRLTRDPLTPVDDAEVIFWTGSNIGQAPTWPDDLTVTGTHQSFNLFEHIVSLGHPPPGTNGAAHTMIVDLNGTFTGALPHAAEPLDGLSGVAFRTGPIPDNWNITLRTGPSSSFTGRGASPSGFSRIGDSASSPIGDPTPRGNGQDAIRLEGGRISLAISTGSVIRGGGGATVVPAQRNQFPGRGSVDWLIYWGAGNPGRPISTPFDYNISSPPRESHHRGEPAPGVNYGADGVRLPLSYTIPGSSITVHIPRAGIGSEGGWAIRHTGGRFVARSQITNSANPADPVILGRTSPVNP